MPTRPNELTFPRPLLWTACILVTGGLLSACASPEVAPLPSPQSPGSSPAPTTALPEVVAVESPPPAETRAVVVSPVTRSVAPATNIPQRQTNVSLLAYADKVRSLPPPDLAQEIARLADPTDPARGPSDDLQLAIALGQTRAPADTTRAQSLLQRVLTNNQEEVRLLHPLARLLSARYAEQKRLEEQLDKQTQQLRDSQRRIDQLNDRLEAMRAIERSLTSRTAPAPVVPAPNGGNGLRPPPP